MSAASKRSGSVVQCANCDKPVYQYPSTMGRKYCSHACRDAVVKARRVNDVDGTAKCAKCTEWKPIGDFVRGRRGRPHSYCKPCSREWFEQLRRKQGRRKLPTREQADENAKRYKREWNRLAAHTRRAGGKMPGRFDIGRMLCAQDARCTYCGQMLCDYHVDHKLPVSRGGTNDQENLHLTCPRCNLRKGTMTHEEFLVSKKRPARSWTKDRPHRGAAAARLAHNQEVGGAIPPGATPSFYGRTKLGELDLDLLAKTIQALEG